MDELVLTLESDAQEGDSSTGTRDDYLLQMARERDSGATVNADRIVEMDDGATLLASVHWRVSGATAIGVPEKQTLERLVCASIAAAYPERADCVANWLERRIDPPALNAKAFSWSYMAGWFPESGCDDFIKAVWCDARIAEQLQIRLRDSGSWSVAERIAV